MGADTQVQVAAGDEASTAGTGRQESKDDGWDTVIEIGGETVYAFLQFERVSYIGWIIAVATVGFQLFAFFVFAQEAWLCGIEKSEDCTLASGGILSVEKDVNGTVFESIKLDPNVSPVGIGMGIVITLAFLLPDFLKGFVFFTEGYYLIAVVHIVISLAAIACVMLYTISTAISDVSILINVVVLLFLTDLDERFYDIHRATMEFLSRVGSRKKN